MGPFPLGLPQRAPFPCVLPWSCTHCTSHLLLTSLVCWVGVGGLSPLRVHLGQLLQLSFPAAVDEQNAQTQEQESFLLGLSDKKDLLPSDRLGPGQGESGSAKARSLRKGIATCWLKGQAT